MDQTYLKLDVTMDDEFSAMQRVLSQIRPSWSWDDVKKKHFTAGITNKICGFYLTTDTKWSDMILVRLYGRNTECIIDRAEEQRNMRILHSIGAGPALYAVLSNALAYGFVQGVTLDTETVRDPIIQQLIAKQMAKLHCIDLTKCPDVDTSVPLLFNKAQKFIDAIPLPLKDPKKQQELEEFGKSVNDLGLEVEEMKALILMHGKSPCGFTHNDLLLENIVYNAKNCSVSFIDYEYGGYNYIYFDISNHFAEHAGVEVPDHSLYPDRAYIKQWLSIYIPEYSKLCGDNSITADTITDEMLNDASDQVNLFCLWSHLFWGIWAIVQAENSTIPFDFMAFAKSRLGAYFDRKAEFIAFARQ